MSIQINTKEDDETVIIRKFGIVYTNSFSKEVKTFYPIIIQELSFRSTICFPWPSSLLLSIFIVCNSQLFKGKRVLEIGAGTGLPSIVASKICGSHCTVTERADEERVLKNLADIIKLNNVSTCIVEPLMWGLIPLESPLLNNCEILIGSDIFYSSEDFDSIFLTFLSILCKNPLAIFYTTYKQRSASRSLTPYLDKYSLKASIIQTKSFVHQCQLDGLAFLPEEGNCKLESFHDIFLIKIEAIS